MIELHYDLLVIGGGAAGISAASAAAAGGSKVALVEREEYLGGILMQCIHTGFGVKRFGEELSGPEYAAKDIALLGAMNNLEVISGAMAFEIKESAHGGHIVYLASAKKGVMKLNVKAVVLAMGCREKNRGNLGIPGTRPAGVMTAGLAQRLLNIEGCVPGKRAVVIGSGDIGLIMARRLSWTGSKVLAVIEILPYPSGLARNIVQCLDDFEIPLMLGHTVSRIIGRDRVEAVEIAPFADGAPDISKSFRLDCDTVLLSVGLVPDNEISRKAGVKLSNSTGGPCVDSRMMTNVPGIFACGNVLHVHDLADNVSEESHRCGIYAADYIASGGKNSAEEFKVLAASNLKYVAPSGYRVGADALFYMRALAPFAEAELCLRIGADLLFKRRFKHVRPSEMISVNISKTELDLSKYNNEIKLPNMSFSLEAL